MTADRARHPAVDEQRPDRARIADVDQRTDRLHIVPAGQRPAPVTWTAPAVAMRDWDEHRRTRYSTDGLADSHPLLSARPRGTRRTAFAATGAALVVLAGLLALVPVATLVVFIALMTLSYTAVLAQRLLLMRRAAASTVGVHVSDEEARAFPASELPVYTVLVPAYQEPEVIARVMKFVDDLEYPRHKLDVKILLEADDAETIAAVRAVPALDHLSVVLVPPSTPRTKPKACNYGLTMARGELLTIYDAEDRPEPLQLRRAVVAFGRASEDTVCLQARLSYHNAHQNLLTRWFTNEYDIWFTWLLPGLVASGAPIPLGGTSNHLRTRVLLEVGGWDPHNVTEDADLGVRFARFGYAVGVLDSVTYEEANSDFVNWVKQRSRWYKGYLKTWLVHMRHPRTLRRELGTKGFVNFTLFVAGTPLLAVLNPLFWGLSMLWWLAKPPLLAELFPAPVYHLGMACWLLGGFGLLYGSLANARSAGRAELFASLLLLPAYWVMMSIAATKAVVQLVLQPSYWEKTTHGLDVTHADPAPASTSASAHPVGT